ncbi:MAG TPA: universal stress protein [Dehalococcoidia bacterium]|jgi:nucleotide-binding universal stress UspA family protein
MYRRILVPLDGSKLAECVMPHIEAIAKLSRATVELVYVIEPVELPTRGGIALSIDDLEQIESHSKHDAQSYLQQIVNKLKSKGLRAHAKILTGKAADSLVDYINNSGFDLLIMATHGRSGISRWIWGSVAEKILRSSLIPILVIRPAECITGTGTS